MSALYTTFMNPKLISDKRMEIQTYWASVMSSVGSEMSRGCSAVSTEAMKLLGQSDLRHSLIYRRRQHSLLFFLLVVLKPNNLVVTPADMDKNLSVGPITITFDRLSWKEVIHVPRCRRHQKTQMTIQRL